MSFTPPPPVSATGSTQAPDPPLQTRTRSRFRLDQDEGDQVRNLNEDFTSNATPFIRCSVEPLEDSSACRETGLAMGMPTKDHEGVVQLTCETEDGTTSRECWASLALQGALDVYSTRMGDGSSKMTNNGKIRTENYTFPKVNSDASRAEGPFLTGDIQHTPFNGMETRNFSIEYREADAGEDRTLDSLLERLSTLYRSNQDTIPVNVAPVTHVITPESWMAAITIRKPISGEVWETQPLKDFLYLYYVSRKQKDTYDQLKYRFEVAGESLTDVENNEIASDQVAVPTTTEMIEYLLVYVVLTGDNIALAKAHVERTMNGNEELVEKLTELSSVMQYGQSLSYEQTKELVDLGFKALDPTLFPEINLRAAVYREHIVSEIPGPSIITVHVNPKKPSVIYVQNNRVYEKRMDTEGIADWKNVITTNKHIIDVAFSPDGKFLTVVEYQSRDVVFYDAENTFKPKRVVSGIDGTATTRVVFSPQIVVKDKQIDYVFALFTEDMQYNRKVFVSHPKIKDIISLNFGENMKVIAFNSESNALSIHDDESSVYHTLLEGYDEINDNDNVNMYFYPYIGMDDTDKFYFFRKEVEKNVENGENNESFWIASVNNEGVQNELPMTPKNFIYFSSLLKDLIIVTDRVVMLPLTPYGIVYESKSNRNIYDASANEEYIALVTEGIETQDIVILKKNR